MRHPPAFGLDLETVVFGPVSGECADEIIQSLIASLLADEINVVNRQEADLILGEHQLSESGWVLRKAPRQSESLGPSVLIAVNVGRCATEQQPSYRDHVRKRKDPDTAEEYEVLRVLFQDIRLRERERSGRGHGHGQDRSSGATTPRSW